MKRVISSITIFFCCVTAVMILTHTLAAEPNEMKPTKKPSWVEKLINWKDLSSRKYLDFQSHAVELYKKDRAFLTTELEINKPEGKICIAHIGWQIAVCLFDKNNELIDVVMCPQSLEQTL